MLCGRADGLSARLSPHVTLLENGKLQSQQRSAARRRPSSHYVLSGGRVEVCDNATVACLVTRPPPTLTKQQLNNYKIETIWFQLLLTTINVMKPIKQVFLVNWYSANGRIYFFEMSVFPTLAPNCFGVVLRVFWWGISALLWRGGMVRYCCG